MKIIHSADWHLGRVFLQMRLLEEQRFLLGKMTEWIVASQPDLFILAGDVFDKVYPGREAIDLLGTFLNKIYHKTGCAIVIIAGNHDSGELINLCSVLQSPKRVLVAGTLQQMRGKPLLIEDIEGVVAVSALPFSDIYGARQYFQDKSIATVEDVLRAQIFEARKYVPKTARWIIAAHSFVQGAAGSESEQSLDRLGGIETVSAALFDGAHYVALGHLHRRQKIAKQEHIRYSGSLMRYGFDELDNSKSVTVVDMDKVGAVSVSQWPLVPRRDLRIVEGYFDDIFIGMTKDLGNKEDYIKLRLFDKHRITDAISRLRSLYPNIVQLEWCNQEQLSSQSVASSREKMMTTTPEELYQDFFSDVTGQPMSDSLKGDLQSALAGLK